MRLILSSAAVLATMIATAAPATATDRDYYSFPYYSPYPYYNFWD